MKKILYKLGSIIGYILLSIGIISICILIFKGLSDGVCQIRNENIQHNKDIENLIGKKVKIVNDTFLIISEGKHVDKLKLSNNMEIDFKVANENVIK